MPRAIFSNNAIAQLSQPLHVGDDRIYVDDLDVFPDPAPNEYFTAVIVGENCQAVEIVQVTGKGPQYLIASARGVEGTTEQDFVKHARVLHQLTAGAMQTMADDYRAFSGFYAGAFPTDPPFDANRKVGTLYFNTTTGAMRVYLGAGSWRDVAVTTPGAQNRWVYELSAADDPINIQGVDIYGNTLALDDTHATMIAVYINGVRQVATNPITGYVGDYTVDKAGDRIVMAAAQPVNTIIHVLEYVGMDATNIPAHDAAHDPHNDLRYAAIPAPPSPGYVERVAGDARLTVDPGRPVSAVNFHTINDAIRTMYGKQFDGPRTMYITLSPGTHTENVSLSNSYNGTGRIIFNSTGAAAATIWRAPANKRVLSIWNRMQVDVQNLTLLQPNAGQHAVSADFGTLRLDDCIVQGGQDCVHITNTGYARLARTTVENGGRVGVYTGHGSTSAIVSCTIRNCGNVDKNWWSGGVLAEANSLAAVHSGVTVIDNCYHGVVALHFGQVCVFTNDLTIRDVPPGGYAARAFRGGRVYMKNAQTVNAPGTNVYYNYQPYPGQPPDRDGAQIIHWSHKFPWDPDADWDNWSIKLLLDASGTITERGSGVGTARDAAAASVLIVPSDTRFDLDTGQLLPDARQPLNWRTTVTALTANYQEHIALKPRITALTDVHTPTDYTTWETAVGGRADDVVKELALVVADLLRAK